MKVRVQITNKGNVNIWHSEKFYINKAAEKLKPLIVVADGEICEDWVITNMQKIGSTKIAYPVTEEVCIDTLTTKKITSVAEILKEVGKWTTSEELLKLVIKKLEVEEKTAFHEIEKELNVGTIQKFLFLDRHILYGLPNWDPKNCLKLFC